VSQVYIRYVVQKGVVAIPKSSRRDRIVQNADADFEIGASESAYLDRLIETSSVRYRPKTRWRRGHLWQCRCARRRRGLPESVVREHPQMADAGSSVRRVRRHFADVQDSALAGRFEASNSQSRPSEVCHLLTLAKGR
jgi:hypothetical protein